MKIHILSATTFLEYFHLISIQHSNLIKVLFCKKDTDQVLKYPSLKYAQNRQDYFEINVLKCFEISFSEIFSKQTRSL